MMRASIRRRSPLRLPLLGFLAGVAWCSGSPAAGPAETLALHAGRVYTGEGEVLERAVIVIREGKIALIGPEREVQVPAGAREVDLRAHVVIPGLIDAETTLASERSDTARTIAPEVRALDGWDAYRDYEPLLRGGVTAIYVAPGVPAASGRRARLVAGRGCVVKTAGWDEDPRRRILKEAWGIQVNLGEISRRQPSIYEPPVPPSPDNPFEVLEVPLPQSRAGEFFALKGFLRRAAEYRTSLDAYLCGSGAPPAWDPQAAALYPLFDGEDRLWVRANKARDIHRMLMIAREHRLKWVLEGGLEADRLASELAADGVPVVFAGAFRPGRLPQGDIRAETTEGIPDERTALRLARAGVEVILHSPTDAEVKDLLLQAATAVHLGMDPALALRSVTLAPARALGVGDRTGSLRPGKDADLAVLAGDPLAGRARVEAVLIDGRVVYQEAPVPEPGGTLILCGKVYTGDGRSIPGGALLVRDGRIAYVGAGAFVKPLPHGVEVVDARDRIVIPGLIDAGTTAGARAERLVPSFGVPEGARGGGGSAAYRLAEAVDPRDPVFQDLMRAGITTVVIAPPPAGWVSGQISVLKPGARDPARALRKPFAGLFFAGLNTRELKKAYEYHKAWEAYEAKRKKAAAGGEGKEGAPAQAGAEAGAKKGPEGGSGAEPKPPERNDAYEPFRALFRGEVPAVVETSNRAVAETALKTLAGEYKARVLLSGLSQLAEKDDLDAVASAVRAHGSGVLLSPPFVAEVRGDKVNRPHELDRRGVPIAFRSGVSGGAWQLPLQAAYAVREGLDPEAALRALTSTPAALFKVDTQVGTLAPGKDADLVFLSGEPFTLSARVVAVMVEGRWVYREDGSEEDRS